MSVITVMEAVFSNSSLVISELCAKSSFKYLTPEEIVAKAAQNSGMPEDKIRNALLAKASIFNRFTHEKERSVAHLRLALADILDMDDLILSGPVTLLLPKRISHVLRVCLVAEARYRVKVAMENGRFSEKQARQQLRQEEENLSAWLKLIEKGSDPWAAELYDIVLPMDKKSPAEAADFILEKAASEVVAKTSASRKALEDFRLAAKVGAALAQEGHNVAVDAKEGDIVLTINKSVLMLSHLEEELVGIVKKVEGVGSVTTKVGEAFHQPDIYRRYNFEVPSKVLLVDDERDFVQTLSERLLMREMGSAIAYDGESALDMIAEDEPEVMILDLNMPGIDGIEVLRRVKKDKPDIEVIVLTGHGTEKDRKVCMELGAFAFLEKPVDIKELSETLMKANEQVRKKRSA
ncbi:MAG: response regulator [Desulfopila sp.]|jgi:CheY-like chemotaxis protein|nr:response regulator [Desulfopila sp.]